MCLNSLPYAFYLIVLGSARVKKWVLNNGPFMIGG